MIMIGKGCGKVYIFKFKNVQYHQAMLSYMILWFNMYNQEQLLKNCFVVWAKNLDLKMKRFKNFKKKRNYYSSGIKIKKKKLISLKTIYKKCIQKYQH